MLGTKYLHNCTELFVFFANAMSSGKFHLVLPYQVQKSFPLGYHLQTLQKIFPNTYYVIFGMWLNFSVPVPSTIKWNNSSFTVVMRIKWVNVSEALRTESGTWCLIDLGFGNIVMFMRIYHLYVYDWHTLCILHCSNKFAQENIAKKEKRRCEYHAHLI